MPRPKGPATGQSAGTREAGPGARAEPLPGVLLHTTSPTWASTTGPLGHVIGLVTGYHTQPSSSNTAEGKVLDSLPGHRATTPGSTVTTIVLLTRTQLLIGMRNNSGRRRKDFKEIRGPERVFFLYFNEGEFASSFNVKKFLFFRRFLLIFTTGILLCLLNINLSNLTQTCFITCIPCSTCDDAMRHQQKAQRAP